MSSPSLSFAHEEYVSTKEENLVPMLENRCWMSWAVASKLFVFLQWLLVDIPRLACKLTHRDKAFNFALAVLDCDTAVRTILDDNRVEAYDAIRCDQKAAGVTTHFCHSVKYQPLGTDCPEGPRCNSVQVSIDIRSNIARSLYLANAGNGIGKPLVILLVNYSQLLLNINETAVNIDRCLRRCRSCLCHPVLTLIR